MKSLPALMLLGAVTSATAAGKPNIVLILADDLGYGDIGCYGHKVNQTPHLDALAAEGMRFTDFHANGPMCSPTRAALLTGMYQQRFGRRFESALSPKSDRNNGLPLEAVTIAEALKAAGYATGMFGKWHLGYGPPFLPTRQGFDEFRGLLTGDGDHHSHISRSGAEDWWHNETVAMEAGYSVDLITRHSIDFIERHRDRPFFLYVAHLAIHFPWQGPDEKAHRVRGGDYWNLSKLGPHAPGEVGPVVRKMIESVDRSVGQIVGALLRLDLRRRTLVIFTSDNGGYLSYSGRHRGEISSNGPLRGQKGDVYEGGHRVPAIFSWPGRVRKGTTDAAAITMDLFPTFLELAGLDTPSPDGVGAVDGVSLVPLLLRNEAPPRRTLFWRIRDDRAARSGDWKLVVTKTRTPALYDLAHDIGERLYLRRPLPDRVRIVTRNGTAVEHPRRPAVGNTSVRTEDRVAKLAAVHGERARLYQKRQEILDLGPSAEALLTEWVHHPKTNWKGQVEVLHELLVRHGPQQTLGAIERVLANGTYHARAIAWVLTKEEK